MRIITFTSDDRRALAHDRYFRTDPRVQRKMEVLWLKSHGLNHDDIAAYADVSRSTVQRYLDESIEGGLSRLPRCCWHQPQSTLVEHVDSLEDFFLKHPTRSAKQARARIEEQIGIRRGLSQVRHFLKDRLGLRWRKTGAIPVPPKKTVEEHARDQARFLLEELEPRLKQARLGRRQVLFVDAAHFVLAPFLGCLWCAAVRAGGLGSQAVQHPGCDRRGDAPLDPRDQRRLHQRRVGLYAAAIGGGGWRGIADHDGAGQRAVSEVRGGPDAGVAARDRTVVLARLLAQPESDRETVAVRAQAVTGFDRLRGFRAVHGCDRSVPGQSVHSTQARNGNVYGPYISDVLKCSTIGRVEYNSSLSNPSKLPTTADFSVASS